MFFAPLCHRGARSLRKPDTRLHGGLLVTLLIFASAHVRVEGRPAAGGRRELIHAFEAHVSHLRVSLTCRFRDQTEPLLRLAGAMHGLRPVCPPRFLKDGGPVAVHPFGELPVFPPKKVPFEPVHAGFRVGLRAEAIALRAQLIDPLAEPSILRPALPAHVAPHRVCARARPLFFTMFKRKKK